jgi:lipoprotein LprG
MRVAGRLAAIALALAVALSASACKGNSSSNGDMSPQQQLAAAKKSLDNADYIGFTMSTDHLPSGVHGLVDAKGTGTHDPAFTGEVDVQAALPINAQLISVDDKVYAKLPLVGWSVINPGDYGAPDPGALMNTDTGLSSLFTKTQDPKVGDSTRQGDQVLKTITGTLPGEDVKALFPSAGTGTFDVTYTLNDDDSINSLKVTGPFYDGSDDVTYDVTFDLNADAVDITAPI